MCSSGSSKAAQAASARLAREQFKWQKDQAAKAEADALARREAMSQGLGKINETFGKFDDPYFQGIENNYLAYAAPQIDQSMEDSRFDLRSNLANRGKLGSSSAAKQYGDLSTVYSGIYRDAAVKGRDYADQHRRDINNAKQASIGQMYASESPDAGLQAATGAVASLSNGPAFEPVSNLLAQAARFATVDYNNSLYNGQSYGAFSPMTNRMANGNQKTVSTI